MEQYRRLITLRKIDIDIIDRVAAEHGFGPRGFSTSVRYILRDWARLTGLPEHAREGEKGDNVDKKTTNEY